MLPNPDPARYADCGIPKEIWRDNGKTVQKLPGGVEDYFYAYGNLHGDVGPGGHFGYKVLAVSFGGTLQLRGAKGASATTPADIATMLKRPEALTAANESSIVSSGSDWARLTGGGGKDSARLTLDRNVAGDWRKGDEIVVTTTDFFPNHSELVQLSAAPSAGKSSLDISTPLRYDHNFAAYDIAAKVNDKAGNTDFVKAIKRADGNDKFLDKAETRAAVALLSRSIRIVSAGDKPDQPFPDENAKPSYMYGGHVVFRQGFEKVQIQGVEFRQLGQGGRLGRYPVHFHIARRVPANTYVINSSINKSMTRWVVLHSTQGVTLARNVGYKSMGHGFFLEDATETDNKLYANIGIYARAPIVSATDNPRGIPGLLDAPVTAELPVTVDPPKFHSNSQYPTVFWVTNGWNAVAGNMAAGAGTCGMCYWYPPAANHDMIDTDPAMNEMNAEIQGQAMSAIAPSNPPAPMKWSGYSAIQAGANTPLGKDRAG